MPELDDKDRQRVARGSFQTLGMGLCDFIAAQRFDAVELCRRWEIEGLEHLERLEQSENGAIVLTGHYGSWEIASYALALYHRPPHVVVRPPDNPFLARRVDEMRGRFGAESIYKRGAVAGMLAELRAGNTVGIVLDQRVPPPHGLVLPFFSRPARTSTTTATLSLRTGAPAMPMFAYPVERDRWRVELLEPIEPTGKGRDAIAALTQRYLDVVEQYIRQRPERWLWMHRRWRLD